MRFALLAVLLACSVIGGGARAEDLDCDSDDALANAAGTLLLSGGAPKSEALVSAVQEAGSDAVLVHALYSPTSDRSGEKKWLQELRSKADVRLACGQAQSDRGSLLIASARAGTLLPLTAASSVVRGTLVDGFTRPEIVIADADGKLTRLGVTPRMLKDGVPLALDLPRPAKIQLVAHGSAGPRPVAERVLPGAENTGPEASREGHVAVADDDASRDLQAAVDALRKGRGQLAVRANRLLAGVASQHAKEVCRQGRLAHELATGEDPEARLAQAGIRAKLVGETIARAADASSAFDELQESPSHLLTLLEPRFTDAGVGSAKDGSGRVCVVVLLAAWPRYVGR